MQQYHLRRSIQLKNRLLIRPNELQQYSITSTKKQPQVLNPNKQHHKQDWTFTQTTPFRHNINRQYSYVQLFFNVFLHGTRFCDVVYLIGNSFNNIN